MTPRFLPALLPVLLAAPLMMRGAEPDGARSLQDSATPLAPGDTPAALQTGPGGDILPVDEAFMLNVVEMSDTLVVMWDIAEGHYLYRKSLTFNETPSTGTLGKPVIPEGVATEDEFFGAVEVFYDRLLVDIPLEGPRPDSVELRVQYQGCAEAGYCYPVQEKAITVTFP